MFHSNVDHVTFQEFHIRRRQETESKHHRAEKECTLEQQRFDQTEITFSIRKNGGYIRSGLGGRSVLVVRQTLFMKFCNLASNNAYFHCLNTFLD